MSFPLLLPQLSTTNAFHLTYVQWSLVAVTIGIISLTLVFDIVWITPLIILTVFFVYYSFKIPILWIFSLIVFHIVILEPTEKISLFEIFFGLYTFVILASWWIVKVSKGEDILIQKSDYYFIAFFVLCVISIIQLMVYKANLLMWFRELIVYAFYFFYFPIRESFIKNPKKTLVAILLSLVILTLFVGIKNVMHYKSAVSSALYMWEILHGRAVANEVLFMSSLILLFSLSTFKSTKTIKIVIFAFIAFYGTVLLLTFSRGYWAGAFFGFIIVFMLLNNTSRKKVLKATVFLIPIIFCILLFLLGNTTRSVISMINNRALGHQSINIKLDASLQARLQESETLMRYIQKNPICGYGLGASFDFDNPIEKHLMKNYYAHNAYLYLIFKLGFVGLFLYLLVYFSQLRNAYLTYRNLPESLDKYIIVGIIGVLSVMLIVSISSPQFYAKDSILVISICWAVIGGLSFQAEQKPNNIGQVSD